MYSAIGVEPTNDSASTSRCASSASTAILSPCTTLNTPSGKPASLSNSASRIDADGSRSDGFSTNVLPRRDRDREHPARHHHREVERRDASDHAERLTQIPVVDAAADLIGEIGLEQIRNAARELDDLDAAHHFALRVREHLAVLTRDDLGEFVVMFVEQFLELEQHARALDRRGFAPCGKRGFRGGDRRIDLGDARERHPRRNRARRRIEHVAEAAARAFDLLAADEMRQRARRLRFAPDVSRSCLSSLWICGYPWRESVPPRRFARIQ